MAEQFGVVGGDDQRFAVHYFRQVFELVLAVEHEVARVEGGFLLGPVRLVGLLVFGLPGYPVVFQPSVHPDAVGQEVLDVFVIQVVADVAVEFAVVGVAGVALLRAPDLFGGLGVASEGRHA